MLYYPKIPGSRSALLAPCIAFEKLDGTNLHWNWHRDFGWHAFGTRRDVFNLSEPGIASFIDAHPELNEAARTFQTSLAEPLEQILRSNPWYTPFAEVRAFTEFVGPNSFAGKHKTDDPKEVVLFDVMVDGYGMLSPWKFVADFQDLPIARVVYEGKFTGQFAEDVRKGKYRVAEGVVCKGGKTPDDQWMAKIKTYDYMARLKQAFADRWEEFWE